MKYIVEISIYTGYCGSYCRICDWHTGRKHRLFGEAMKSWDEYGGFPNLIREAAAEKIRDGLAKLADTTFCSGCKAEFEGAGDRCDIRLCAHNKKINPHKRVSFANSLTT